MRSRLQFLDHTCTPDELYARPCQHHEGVCYEQFPSPAVSYIPLYTLLQSGVARSLFRSLFRLTPDLISVTHEPVLRVSVVVRVSTPAPMGSSLRAISPREGVKMTPPHQVPAATPQPEGLDACPSKAIHTTINQHLNAAVPVRTRTPSRSKPHDPHMQHKPRRYSPTTSPDSLPTFRAPSQSTTQTHMCRRTTCRRERRSTKTSWRLRSRRAA